MNNVFLKLELKRAFCNFYFAAAVLIGCVLTISDFYQNIYPSLWMNYMPVIKEFPISLYSSTIGLHAQSLQQNLLFLMAPLLGALPFADSYYTDKRGYIKQLYSRGTRKQYLSAKCIAVFLSGGTAFVLPQIANLLLAAMYLPALRPEPSTKMFAPARDTNPLAGLYIEHPLLYLALYLIIGFIIVGLFANISNTAALFFKSRLAVMLFPFILYMIMYIFCSLLRINGYNPYDILLPTQLTPSSVAAQILIPVILAAGGILPVFLIAGKEDVF